MSVYFDKQKGRWRFNFDCAVPGAGRHRASRLLPKGWTADQRARYDQSETARLYALASGVERESRLIDDAVLVYLKERAPLLKNKSLEDELARCFHVTTESRRQRLRHDYDQRIRSPLPRIVRGCGMKRLIAWLRAWQRRREWTPERQLEHLRQMVQADHRWLAHDKTADALTSRYLAALAPDWMSVVHTNPDHFRREIGLQPVHTWREFGSQEHLARLNRIATAEYYGLEPWEGPDIPATPKGGA